ncbi:MAG: hypothetical protein ACPLW9_00800 [Minisyncoccales bacterium]
MGKDDRLTVIVRLGQAEIEVYEQVMKELNLKIPALATVAVKLLLLVAKTIMEGGHLKLVKPDNREVIVEILELEGLTKKQKTEGGGDK